MTIVSKKANPTHAGSASASEQANLDAAMAEIRTFYAPFNRLLEQMLGRCGSVPIDAPSHAWSDFTMARGGLMAAPLAPGPTTLWFNFSAVAEYQTSTRL